MQKYLDPTLRFLKDEAGASSAEYALLVTLIGVAIVAGVSALGTALGTYYDGLASRMPGGG